VLVTVVTKLCQCQQSLTFSVHFACVPDMHFSGRLGLQTCISTLEPWLRIWSRIGMYHVVHWKLLV